MKKIIDFHSHLGDVFHQQKNVTFKQNVQPKDMDNPFLRQEESGFVDPLIGPSLEEFKHLIDAGQQLCWENTLENLSRKLDHFGIAGICVLPVLPNTSFEEYLAASKLDDRLLPFSCADYSLSSEALEEKLLLDIKRGARGLKIHPVLQNQSLRDEKVALAVEIFGSHDLPIISHCGANDYYASGETYPRNPEYGDVSYFIELAQKFPNYSLVAAHSGGLMGGEMEILAEGVKGLQQVFVDTTFRSALDIKRQVDFFGQERVLFGTDNPFSTHKGAIAQVEQACAGNVALEHKILYQNAATLLHLQ